MSDGGDLCQCVKDICDTFNVSRSFTRSQRKELIVDRSLTMLERLAGSGRQVLRGFNWPVQGYNGSNAAQLSQPWGSTLTFQRHAGVSCVQGLRHGVAMHPRGRHLREDMTLASTWESRHGTVNNSNNINLHNHETTTTIGSRTRSQSVKESLQRSMSMKWFGHPGVWQQSFGYKIGKLRHLAFNQFGIELTYHSGSDTEIRNMYRGKSHLLMHGINCPYPHATILPTTGYSRERKAIEV